ncbi:hypothetical protein [Periweissella fabalis]|uniref:Uncharacterized protein n=1 Tax=Periweissella fabalis TaxID=1070421 RepID=A0A7X6S2I1_9LACO|nr:hypothetical protein [Periweissella fabalis]MCM0599289.1 hypothetical protein [Periweissella fabalis]NKZ23568.1 hypothetical protein [Periweissella fabalis]
MLNNYEVTTDSLQLTLPHEYGTLIISDQPLANNDVTLYFAQHQLVAIEQATLNHQAFDRVITFVPAWDMEPAYLLAALTNQALTDGWTPTEGGIAPTKVPTNYATPLKDYLAVVMPLLDWLGYDFTTPTAAIVAPMPPVKKAGKPQHRWNKELSTVPFYVDYAGVTATVYWPKRHEMRIVAGATLVPDAPLNQDGTLGFAARLLILYVLNKLMPSQIITRRAM